MLATHQTHVNTYTAQGWWGTQTLADLFEQNAAACPNDIALTDPPNRPDLTVGAPQRLTYAQLKTQVDNLAWAFLQNGIGKDDIIVVQLPNIAELVVVYLASAKMGAIVSPVPVQYRTHELKQILALTEASAFITVSHFGGFNFVEMAQSLQTRYPTLKRVIALADAPLAGVLSLSEMIHRPCDATALEKAIAQNPPRANDVFTICWTSGTESDPKGVPRSHNHWISIAFASVDGAKLSQGDALLNPFPLVNMSAIGGMLTPWLLTRGKFALHHPLSLPVFLAQISSEKINYTVAPPMLMNMLLRNPALLANADLSHIKSIGSGSAPLSPWMVSQWHEKYGISVLNLFGSNEGCSFCSGPDEIPDPAERARFFPRWGADGVASTNRGARGMKSKLVDPLTRETITQSGVVGEMAISGPNVFDGYFRRPDLTEKSFDSDGYFLTGDLFAIDGAADALNRYRFVGRLKDLIIRGGMKIAAEELENLLVEHPKVQDVAIIGLPSARDEDEVVCAVIVPKKDQTITLTDLNEFLREKDLAAFKLPKKMVILEALPRNPVGKILKRNLKEQFGKEKSE
ncbi:MAG TPA: class I adenylate-forming enzyme family protein [Thermoflexales bacterium]|nr:class I adenylate-forming enzyme family protein [Thermoflexales bacterium]HQZ98960.1 class I adenylate-forming enzyme family protein [Thermoflexales bacterium]